MNEPLVDINKKIDYLIELLKEIAAEDEDIEEE